MGFLNFFFTNVFEVLFACTCMLNTTTEKKQESYCSKVFRIGSSYIGTYLGAIIAISVTLAGILFSARICGDKSKHLLSFALKTQLVGIVANFIGIFLQYVPFVIEIGGFPCLSLYTITGSWYKERCISDSRLNDIKDSYHVMQQRRDFRYLLFHFKRGVVYDMEVDKVHASAVKTAPGDPAADIESQSGGGSGTGTGTGTGTGSGNTRGEGVAGGTTVGRHTGLKKNIKADTENDIIGCLRVHLQSATNLKVMDYFGSSDPYAIIVLGESTKRSYYIHNTLTLNPHWKESFMFEWKVGQSKLVISVFDKDLITTDGKLTTRVDQS